MKVMFHGYVEKESHGCIPCGANRKRSVLKTRKTFVMPSGVRRAFYAGRTAEVSDTDGVFLTESFPDAFEEVK